MPRPRPLTNISSARSNHPEFQVLTPRTPHSRSGRAEEGYTEFELQQISEQDDDFGSGTQRQQQSVPLLSSSASDSFPSAGYRNRGDDFDEDDKRARARGELTLATVLSRLPLVMGSLVAGFLLFLTILSYKRPDKIHKYFGVNTTATATNASASSHNNTSSHHNTSTTTPAHIISYAAYTKFPLLPIEYKAECGKLNKGYMSHGKYWEPHKMGTMDVIHQDDAAEDAGAPGAVCSSTVTYMLGEEVGLLADLALMAQAATLAWEVVAHIF